MLGVLYQEKNDNNDDNERREKVGDDNKNKLVITARTSAETIAMVISIKCQGRKSSRSINDKIW